MSGSVTADVVVLGGGVIGLSVAWRSAQRGLSVVVVDPAPGSGASGTAAGMLAPVTELHYAERALLDLTVESARRYPDFAAELTDRTGVDVGYRRTGTVSVAWDAADLAALRDLRAFQLDAGLDVDLLTGAELRRLEPHLSPGLPGGTFAVDDHQVEPARLLDALFAAAAAAGVRIERQRAERVLVRTDRVVGATLADGRELRADRTVLACGAWSRLDGLPAEALPPVRPVKGQTLHLRGAPGLLDHVVRGAVRGVPVYLVPRDDGRMVVGASSEDAGFDTRARAGAVFELLRDAQALVPAVAELELVEVRTSLRPGTPDNAPLVGPGSVEGLVVATGHYRNGVLLAPVTADGVATLLADGELPPIWDRCRPDRFAAARSGSP